VSPSTTETAASRHRFEEPPLPQRDDGEARRVGFELEFSGVSLDAAASALRGALGGETVSADAAQQRIDVPGSGHFNVEIDSQFIKDKAREVAGQKGGGVDWIDPLSRAATLLVPVEVVCPPLPLTRLEELHALTDALREAGARGTEDSLLAAFGVHINTELPALDAATIHDYLRAFALLQWWLVETHQVDPSRRVTPYIDPYPEAYLQAVLATEEADLDTVFDTYLEHNATRNRALDLLPLLAHIDEERIASTVDDPRIKSRPAFHYRLPNCHIERRDWSLAESWNTWCVVEKLAADREALAELAAAFRAARRPLLGVSRSGWKSHMDQWLNDRGWA